MNKFVYFLQDKVLHQINLQDLIYLFSKGKYVTFVIAGKRRFVIRTTISNAIELLPKDMFIQTHRSYAVSINFMDKIAIDHLVADGKSIPIAKAYYKNVINHLVVIQ